jgi:hypothetical protein
MTDLKISACSATAGLLWVTGLALILVTLFVGDVPALGQLGLYVTGAAMVLNVRTYFCRFLARETAAFKLGVEAGGLRSVDR